MEHLSSYKYVIGEDFTGIENILDSMLPVLARKLVMMNTGHDVEIKSIVTHFYNDMTMQTCITYDKIPNGRTLEWDVNIINPGILLRSKYCREHLERMKEIISQ